LALLFKLTEFGQSIGKIAHLDLPDLIQIYTSIMHKPYDEKNLVIPVNHNVDYEKILSSFYLALTAYKLDIIYHELEKAKNLLGPRELCLNIIAPLFKEIGLKVDRKELTIAQEHTISALVSFFAGQMIGAHYQKTLQRDELIIITTPEGEMHEIGILSSALLCVHHGVKFIFMGASLPADSLWEAANALNAHAVLIGATRERISETSSLDRYLNELKANLNSKTEIWMGGNAEGTSKQELAKKKVSFFTSLNDFDVFLSRF
jgi:methanogenic corrinoid protein MtbC1